MQEWDANYPTGDDKARLLLFCMDPSGKLFKVRQPHTARDTATPHSHSCATRLRGFVVVW